MIRFKGVLVFTLITVISGTTAVMAQEPLEDGEKASKKPLASAVSGRYESLISVTLQSINGGDIYYSLDGSDPIAGRSLYAKPLAISKTTVIRAIAVEPGKKASPPMTSTYIIGPDYGLPIVSLVTDPKNLTDPEIGIERHPWDFIKDGGKKWERDAAVCMIGRSGEPIFQFDNHIGIRLHGGISRLNEKKSYRVYWRGKHELNYPLFTTKKNLIHFKRLILRSGGNDFPRGFDGINHWTMLRSWVMGELWGEVGGNYSAAEPVVLFLNGRFWGMYTLREYIDEYYLQTNLGVDPKRVDVVAVHHPAIYAAEEGDLQAWQETLAFFRNADLSKQDQYEKALSLIDVDNFTDYQIMQIYGGNWDWPQNNDCFYRERVPGAKWHWVMFDTDHAFNMNCPVTHNTLAWAARDRALPGLSPPWQLGPGDEILNTTLILRKLLENAGYRKFFIKRTDELLKTVLQPDHVRALIEDRANMIEPCVNLEEARWGPSNGSWGKNVKDMISFARRRPDILRLHYHQYFRTEDFSDTKLE